MRTKFTPEVGQIYRNQGGGTFRCLEVAGSLGEYKAFMQNVKSLWTFLASGCGMYEDGTIDWDYSTGGHFDFEDTKVRCSACSDKRREAVDHMDLFDYD